MTLVQITASFDTLDTLRATPLPGEEFPYATTGYCGVKCCSKCGATKTPQWREGPCGEWDHGSAGWSGGPRLFGG